MKVIIVQADLAWEDTRSNRLNIESLLAKSDDDNADLVVLPEMFSTGFSMNSDSLAETMEGETVTWMRNISAKGRFALAGSLIIKEQDSYFNRLVFCKPGGILNVYDKAHLFRMEKENNFFTRGIKRAITEHMGFSINLQICYDLRFPVWSRNVNNNYDILLYVANWPEARQEVWSKLLVARAIENQCYVIGANRVGSDGNGIAYSGGSVIIDPKGRILASLEPHAQGIAGATLSLEELRSFRDSFPVWKDADEFELL